MPLIFANGSLFLAAKLMLFGKQISKRISCLLLVLVHISFIYFQANYQLSVLRYNGLLVKQSFAKQVKEKETPGTISSESTDLSKSKLVPVKRFFQNQCMMVPAPAGINEVIFIPYQFERYTSPSIIKFSAGICPERGPPVAA
jgi:hypothetical protein